MFTNVRSSLLRWVSTAGSSRLWRTRRPATLLAFAACYTFIAAPAPASDQQPSGNAARVEKIDPYHPRFGRTKPLIAVVGLNAGTETVDFVVPFGVLSRSGVADVISVSTAQGPVRMGNWSFQLQETLDSFDRKYPEGADYVIVPNTSRNDDPTLVNWVAAQGRKSGTLVSICLGAMVVANTGLMDGHRATSYYASEADRATKYPNVKWQSNVRYVADGKIVSSAGISAAIPASIALVEAIAGHTKARQVATELGVPDWGTEHNSDVFQGGQHDEGMRRPDADLDVIAVSVKAGDDEVALALTADAYFFSGKSRAYVLSTSSAPITLRHGLAVIPNLVAGAKDRVTRVLPPLNQERPMRALDEALQDIAKTYGHHSAAHSAMMMEYPGFKR